MLGTTESFRITLGCRGGLGACSMPEKTSPKAAWRKVGSPGACYTVGVNWVHSRSAFQCLDGLIDRQVFLMFSWFHVWLVFYGWSFWCWNVGKAKNWFQCVSLANRWGVFEVQWFPAVHGLGESAQHVLRVRDSHLSGSLANKSVICSSLMYSGNMQVKVTSDSSRAYSGLSHSINGT